MRATITDKSLSDRPMYFVSSNTHSLVNLVSATAGASEDEIVGFLESQGPDYMIDELERFLHVVRDDDRRHMLEIAQLDDLVVDGRCDNGIESGRRIVEQEQPRVCGDRACDGDAPTLAPRQL